MTIKTPVKGLSAVQLHQINQEGTNGWYPIGRDNFWHGGVNVNFADEETGSKPIRAFAKGKIIAYRLTNDFLPLTKTYDEGKDKNLKYYIRDYSHNFVLIRHRHEPPNSPAIEYYALYMHLAPFKVYDTKYDENEVSIFKRWECQIKTPPAFTGDSLRNASGDIIRIIPWGGAVSVVEEEGTLYKGEPLPDTRKKAVCTLWGPAETGFIWIADFNPTTWRCTSRGRTARNADKGVLVYKTADPTSEVIRILPAGTRIYFEEPYQSVSKEGTIKPGQAGIKLDLESPVLGYIDVTASAIETIGKVIDPVLSDEVQTCEIDVHAGEIIGWPGKDGVCAHNSFHFEVFAKDEHVNGSNGFWDIGSDQGQPDGVYKIAKDTPFFRMKKNNPVAHKTIPKHTILELVGTVDSYGSFPKANARQIKVVTSQVGWVLRDELSWLSATGGNVGEAKYHLAGDALRWFWKQKPAVSMVSTPVRDIYMGLRKTYQGNNVELVLEEQGTAGTVQVRKVRYTLTPPLYFNGWIANEDSIAGLTYTDNGIKKKRFYAKEDITAVYNRNPEHAVFQPSSQKAAHDIYIFKKDCIQAKDGNGEVWTGFPKPFIQSGEIFFDKEEFDEIEHWVWLKGDESAFTKVNIFDWSEFFQQCSENDFTGGEDGFCDAVTVFEFIDANRDGMFTNCELKNAIRHPTVKHQLRRLVCEYPSSWFLPSSTAGKDAKWGNRLKGPHINADTGWYQALHTRMKEWNSNATPPRYGFDFSEEKYAAFLELVEKTCFLNQVDGFTEDETLWHFHPIAFVQHLKRLFTGLITMEMLECAVHNGDKDYFKQILPHLNTYAEIYSVNTPLRIAHFLSQVGHESGFKVREENLYYSINRMREVFGCKDSGYANSDCPLNRRKRSKLWSEPNTYANNPENLANYVYGNRSDLGNGDEASGDGYKYRGRGIIQLTGKNNYQKYTTIHNDNNPDDTKDFVANPDLIVDNIQYGIESAFVWWDMNNVNNLCTGESDDVVKKITKKVNGGYNGLSGRTSNFEKILKIIKGE